MDCGSAKITERRHLSRAAVAAALPPEPAGSRSDLPLPRHRVQPGKAGSDPRVASRASPQPTGSVEPVTNSATISALASVTTSMILSTTAARFISVVRPSRSPSSRQHGLSHRPACDGLSGVSADRTATGPRTFLPVPGLGRAETLLAAGHAPGCSAGLLLLLDHWLARLGSDCGRITIAWLGAWQPRLGVTHARLLRRMCKALRTLKPGLALVSPLRREGIERPDRTEGAARQSPQPHPSRSFSPPPERGVFMSPGKGPSRAPDTRPQTRPADTCMTMASTSAPRTVRAVVARTLGLPAEKRVAATA